MDQAEQNPKYSLAEKSVHRFWQNFLSVSNGLLSFFNLTETKRFWGVVYDSVTKQPIDPVIVKLFYTDGREVETCITDLEGRYGFFARPGKFKIFARRTNYTFPSQLVPGSNDGVYENLYHGEFFVLSDDREVIAPNIPMDPANADWNQQAKLAVVKTHAFRQWIIKRFMGIIFWFGFIICLLYSAHFYPAVPWYLYTLLGFYALVLVLRIFSREPRLWGRLRSGLDVSGFAELLFELHNPHLPRVVFGKAQVKEDGRFLLRASPGQFTAHLYGITEQKEKVLLGLVPIKIGRAGAYNGNLVLK